MKFCATLLKVVLVVVFVEAVLCDIESGDPDSKTLAGGVSSGATERVICPPEASDLIDVPMHIRVLMLGAECKLRENMLLMGRNSTAEEIVTTVHVFCAENSTPLKECLAEKATHVGVCLNQTMSNVFNIFREYIDELIDFGCSQDGTHYINLIKGALAIKESGSALAKEKVCTSLFYTVMKEIAKSDVEVPFKVFILYEELNTFYECVNKIEIEESLKNEMIHFTEHLNSRMKCIHPKDGTLVTCASIDATLISSPSVCAIKTHDTESELYEVLEDDAGKVFSNIMTHDTKVEDKSTDIELLREDLKNYCSANEMEYVLSSVKLISQICLNETGKNEFKILLESVHEMFDVACVKYGKNLADIMFEVYRLKRTSPDHGHAVWECIDVAKATRNEVNEHRISTKNMRFYHEVESFKKCLIHKFHENPALVDTATSMLTGMLAALKCANPEDGTTVLCESLMPSHHHHDDHHHH